MKASEWIDKVKASRGWDSDYRVAKELELTRQAVSEYRNRVKTMDEETSIRVADALNVDPAAIIIDQIAERSKSPAVQAALRRIAHSLCILCKVTIATSLIANFAS
jgi:predicted transcriptional regulator